MAIDVGKLRVRLGLDDKEFSTGMKNANARLQAFSRRLAIGAGALAAAAATGLAVATKASFRTVDAQAKLAQSLGTSTKSIQVLARAGDLAGVSMAGIEQGTKDLTRRLSQAAATGKGGPADALERLSLSAAELMKLPLDERVRQINGAIEEFVPAAERAAVAGQLFGEEGSIAMGRLDAATLDQAIKDVKDFGVAVSDVDADKIEEANDAVSRLGLIAVGTGNKLAVALAPMVTGAAEAIANLFREGGAAYIVIGKLTENMGRLAAWAGTAAAIFGGKLAVGLALAVARTVSLSGALVVLRGALIRTGIGAIVVLAGELVYQFTRLVKGSGGFGNALGLLKDVAVEAFDRIGTAMLSLGEWMKGAAFRMKAWFVQSLADMASHFNKFMNGPIRNGIAEFMGWLDPDKSAADFLAEMGFVGVGKELQAAANSAQNAAKEANALATSLLNAATAPLKSMEAINAAIAKTDEAAGNAGTSAEDLKKQLEELDNAGASADGGMADKLKDTTDKIKTMSESIRDTLQSSLGSAFEGLLAGTASVREALAGIFADLAKMAANRLIQTMLGGLFGGGPGGGALGAIIPGFAAGTSFAPGGMALVGERGPELVNLPRGSQVVPNDQLGAVAGGSTKIINVMDPSIVGDYLGTAAGERMIMNVISRNRSSLNA